MSESTRDTAAKVIAEAFNTGHKPTHPDFPELEESNRHDGHLYYGACWLCRGDAEQLTTHIVDALAAAGLLRTTPGVTREQADVLVDIAMRLGSHGDTIAALYTEMDAQPVWDAASRLLDWQWAKVTDAGLTVQDGGIDA